METVRQVYLTKKLKGVSLIMLIVGRRTSMTHSFRSYGVHFSMERVETCLSEIVMMICGCRFSPVQKEPEWEQWMHPSLRIYILLFLFFIFSNPMAGW
jgi:hypothetical protein